MPKKSKGRVWLRVDDERVWSLSFTAIGMLMRIHRAVMLCGNRDHGLLGYRELEAIVTSNCAVRELFNSGIIKKRDAIGAVFVSTWPRQDMKHRQQGMERTRRHKEKRIEVVDVSDATVTPKNGDN